MTHDNPLHVDLLTQCWCCQALQPFKFTSATDQVVCSFCVRHLGADRAEKRDRDHLRMWVEILVDERESNRNTVEKLTATLAERDAALAGLTTRVDELTNVVAGEFDRAPTAQVRSLLENEVVKRADKRAALEQRRNDRLMAAIWRVDRLHREGERDPHTCVCGTSLARCAEWQAVEPVRQALRDWEAKNLQLLRDGQRHALPDDHPDVVRAAPSRR
ncbi:hypothetical protein SAMN05216282_12328 [Cryobacterium psychrotolerans]|uniref:Uncharacterized protein n=1 Tax=Cryobacterium psychrotolerans TaxID=386301 RepID=A0A1G9GR37_9MICO|nr:MULTISPECIES: hypothetical protein [Cryobacterium]TFD42117.1 hypothetical protein E3T33_12865 [Cryobacterium sp. TMT1-2-1]TFD86747.1 hypothetical protein E3T56_06570 [Cryobacterium psychrotolerans]SDL03072.1 hypothetical protein SAMN05216282_12328 [Cryobacterium psychrotolerans]